MMTELEALRKGVCANCEEQCQGNLTAIDAIRYGKYALCPECYWDDLMNRSKNLPKLETNPQECLPLLGGSPKKIEMASIPFAGLVLHDWHLLKDVVVECMDRGGFMYYRLITPNHESAQGIINYLKGLKKEIDNV